MTTFPTLPSGAFWVFSIAMIVAGRSLALHEGLLQTHIVQPRS